MKKAFTWLDKHKVAYVFQDYKLAGADKAVLQRAIKTHGWENIINRKGTTWRNLSEKTKNSVTEKNAVELALENPSIITRPLVTSGEKILLGFSEEDFKDVF